MAILQSSEASGTSHADALLTELTATRAGGREDVRPLPVIIADDDAGDPAPLERAAAEIAAFSPHVVFNGGAPLAPGAYRGGVARRAAAAVRDRGHGFLDLVHSPGSARTRTSARASTGCWKTATTRPTRRFGRTTWPLSAAAGPSSRRRRTTRSMCLHTRPWRSARRRFGPPAAGWPGQSAAGTARRADRGRPRGHLSGTQSGTGRGDNIDLQGTRTSPRLRPEPGDTTTDLALLSSTAGGRAGCARRTPTTTRRPQLHRPGALS